MGSGQGRRQPKLGFVLPPDNHLKIRKIGKKGGRLLKVLTNRLWDQRLAHHSDLIQPPFSSGRFLKIRSIVSRQRPYWGTNPSGVNLSTPFGSSPGGTGYGARALVLSIHISLIVLERITHFNWLGNAYHWTLKQEK